MIEEILELPTAVGALVVMGLVVVTGLAAVLASHRFLFKNQLSANLGEATRTLFLANGLLVGLFLSLTFADVVVELNIIKRAVELEAVAISDAYDSLQRFNHPDAAAIQQLLIEYTESVIDDDWPALANDSLSKKTDKILQRLESAVLDLETKEFIQERVWDRIITHVDLIFDYRLARLEQALAPPPFFLIVVVFGFFVTLVCFGLHPPDRTLLILVSLYLAFVGLVVYLILAFSDPFQGMPGVDNAPLRYVLDEMRDARQLP